MMQVISTVREMNSEAKKLSLTVRSSSYRPDHLPDNTAEANAGEYRQTNTTRLLSGYVSGASPKASNGRASSQFAARPSEYLQWE